MAEAIGYLVLLNLTALSVLQVVAVLRLLGVRSAPGPVERVALAERDLEMKSRQERAQVGQIGA